MQSRCCSHHRQMILSGDVVDHDWSGMSNDVKCKKCNHAETVKPNINQIETEEIRSSRWRPVPASPVQQGRPKCHQCHGAHTLVHPFAEFSVFQWISIHLRRCRWPIAMLTCAYIYVDISQGFAKHAVMQVTD